MRFLKLLVAASLLSVISATATAANDRPDPPQDVFRYVVYDTGDAFEIDWAVEDGAYLYRDRLSFETATPNITLGAPVMPEGEVHSDEFFGEQVIYRHNFFIRIPYGVTGKKPDAVDLVINSQGCLDAGFCYLPQTWTEAVELKQDSADKKLKFGEVPGNSLEQALPVDEVFTLDAFAIDGNTVEFGIRALPDYYVYKSRIGVRSLTETAKAGQLDLPKGKEKTDEWLGEQEVYFDEVIGKVAIARATPEAMDLELEIAYQGCKVDGICYLPQTKVLQIKLPEAQAITDLSTVSDAADEPMTAQARLAKILLEDSIWYVVAMFFLAGLGLAFTPCVLPMVPILSGIIAGDGDNVSRKRGFTLALSYVMGMAIVYTLAGIIAAAAGLQLQATFNQPWVLIVFAGLFVVLALGMFGVYDLQMPSGLQSKLSNISGKQKSGTMIGAFVMGALSALIVTACVAPALVAALTLIAQTGDMVRGGTALFAMSMGMGAPLLLVGAAQGELLPKAGGWMIAVKNAFGFMMLGLAIWMLSRILPGNVTMLLWAILVFMAGVSMGGLTTLDKDASVKQLLGKGFGFLAVIYGIVLLLGGLSGGSNPLQPLASLNLGAAVTEEEKLPFKRIKTVDDLDREIAAASKQGKTVMLDFYADWCVACHEMEAYTFPKEEVLDALSNTVWLQADVTKNDAEDQVLLKRFKVFGPPTIIFLPLTANNVTAMRLPGT